MKISEPVPSVVIAAEGHPPACEPYTSNPQGSNKVFTIMEKIRNTLERVRLGLLCVGDGDWLLR